MTKFSDSALPSQNIVTEFTMEVYRTICPAEFRNAVQYIPAVQNPTPTSAGKTRWNVVLFFDFLTAKPRRMSTYVRAPVDRSWTLILKDSSFFHLININKKKVSIKLIYLTYLAIFWNDKNRDKLSACLVFKYSMFRIDIIVKCSFQFLVLYSNFIALKL